MNLRLALNPHMYRCPECPHRGIRLDKYRGFCSQECRTASIAKNYALEQALEARTKESEARNEKAGEAFRKLGRNLHDLERRAGK